jgi:probable F420-dependent oxidoreductase
MQVGIAMFVTDKTVHPAELGALAEARGFDSLFVPEHTHIPLSRLTPHPRGPLQEHYKRTLDPFVALTAAAAATTSLLVGTGVCLVPERDPIILAKEVATLDLVSGGRFLFGVGAGWNVDEMQNHGTDPSSRFRLMRERVEAMKAIWTQDEASYHGELVDFDPIWEWPKPVQKPHPPVLMGGGGPRVLDRVLDYADGWVPNAQPFEVLAPRYDELQRRAAVAADEDRRVRVLGRLWPAPDPVEVDVAAVVGGLLFGPDRLHRLDALAHQTEAAAGVGAVICHLLEVPTRTDAEQEAAAGEQVEARHLLGGDDRVTLDDQADRGPDPQALGSGSGRRQGDEGVVEARVLAWQLAAGRIGRRSAGRDVGVLGREQGLEAPFLDHPAHLRRLDHLVGREPADPEVQSSTSHSSGRMKPLLATPPPRNS